MGSVATYEAMARIAAQENANASRAYFPPLRDIQKTTPKPLIANERCLVELANQISSSIGRSPHAVRQRKREKAETGLVSQLSVLRKYYFGKQVKKQANGNGEAAENGEGTSRNDGGTSNSSGAVDGGKGKDYDGAKDDSSAIDDDAEIEDLWDLDKCWIIPETLPVELRPSKLPFEKRKLRPKKRRRVDEGSDETDVPNVKDILDKAPEGEDAAGRDATQPTDTRDEDGEDGDQIEGNAPERAEEDDDLELDADYQTGARFDDDDGYEEHDSGAEEATF